MELLLGNEAITIRPIAPTDGSRLVAFHERLSTETQRLRFFSFHPHLPPAEVERFVNVDGVRRMAFVAALGDEIVGVARLDRPGDSPEAEIAVVVQDDMQGRGIGTALLKRIVAHARRQGLTTLTASTLPENNRVRAVFRGLGLDMTSRYTTGLIEVSMALTSPRGERGHNGRMEP